MKRRNVVLSQMMKYEKISEEAYQKAIEKELKLDYSPVKADRGIAPFFREQVRKELVKWAEQYEKETG